MVASGCSSIGMCPAFLTIVRVAVFTAAAIALALSGGIIWSWSPARNSTGMLMLAFVFQRLATRKPDLDAGIFAYAKAGFGDYVGFNSAIGYWASACAGNTSYWVLISRQR